MDNTKPATLEPCEDAEVLDLISGMIPSFHRSLRDARIRVFWLVERPLSDWGGVKALGELEWWLSGAARGEGVDAVIKVNRLIWLRLSDEGREGYIDLLLYGLRRKDSGKTAQETVAGDRPLYEKIADVLKLPPEVVARRPALAREFEEIRRLRLALADPEQYRLEFEAKEHPPADPRPAANGQAKTIRASGRFMTTARHITDYGPVALRYSEFDARDSSLTGVFLFESDEDMAAVHDLDALEYDDTPHVLRSVRGALEDERNARGSIRAADVLDDSLGTM